MTRDIYHRRWTSIREIISRNDGLGCLISPPFAHRTCFARPAKLSFLIIRGKFLRYRERQRTDKSVRIPTRFVKTLTNVFADIDICIYTSKYPNKKCPHSAGRVSLVCKSCTRGLRIRCVQRYGLSYEKFLQRTRKIFYLRTMVTSRTAGWGSEESCSSPISQTIQTGEGGGQAGR